MEGVKFYLCLTCGNIICKVVDSGVTPECCGTEMELMEPKRIDSGAEHHVPVIRRIDACSLRVEIGRKPHPASPSHHIVFIALRTEDGVDIRVLPDQGSEWPHVDFSCMPGEAIGVYSYCNLHGLWYLPIDED